MLLIRNKKSIFAESFTRMKQKILERIGYSNRIERMFGRGMMIALTGQRRVGKSCVMRRIYNHIAENEQNHVIYIDKEKTSFDMIANYQDFIPLPVIERRYKAGLKNLFEIFMKEVDIWILFDNSLNKGERVAFGGRQLPTKIKDIVKFNIIKDYE